jgi:large subunit ribosomal protein L10
MERAVIKRKIEAVEVLTEKLKSAKTVVAFDYPGLTVEQFTQLRSELRKAGAEVKVYKNNISRRASIAAGYEALADTFVGAKALAISYDDVVAPAKIIYDFAKTNKAVVIQSGVIEGSVVGVNEIQALATLPSRETLLTMLAVGLLTPVKELAVGLNMISENQE